MRYLLIFSILLVNFLVAGINQSLLINSSSFRNYSELKGVIGVMVEFPQEYSDDPLTSGNGRFLNEIDIGYINNQDIERCSETLLDPPPHNAAYFSSQIKAVKNYFHSISNGGIDFDYEMIPYTYQLSNSMQSYATSDNDITRLYFDAIFLAKNQIIQKATSNGWDSDDFIVVVFHAGLGQELGAGLFDPTIYDIHSAYIDEDMISSMINSIGEDPEDNYHLLYDNCNNDQCNIGSSYIISDGILLPETLNMIYYDVIEDLYSVDFIDDEDLENIFCGYQTGMTGLFANLLGYRLGFPVMQSTENIQPITRIGKFGLMDYGAFNGRGIIPALPHVWSRIYHPQINTTVIDITTDLFNDLEQSITLQIPYDLGNTVYKVKISENEYFLLENRKNELNVFDDILDEPVSLNQLSYYLNCDPVNETTNENNWQCDESVQNDLKALFDEPNVGEDYFYLDIVKKIIDCDGCTFLNETTNVIEGFGNYDYGLPGSGLLIWHIQEPSYYDIINGMNNDINNKAIHLEEADGMVNIGFPDPDPFQQGFFPYGNEFDFWFRDHFYYEEINDSDDILFNQNSIPNSNAYGGIPSNISIEIGSIVNNDINVTISYQNDDIEIIDDTDFDHIRHLGNAGDNINFYSLVDTLANTDIWYGKDYSPTKNTIVALYAESGNASVTTQQAHGLSVGDKVYIEVSNATYNEEVIVVTEDGSTGFTYNTSKEDWVLLVDPPDLMNATFSILNFKLKENDFNQIINGCKNYNNIDNDDFILYVDENFGLCIVENESHYIVYNDESTLYEVRNDNISPLGYFTEQSLNESENPISISVEQNSSYALGDLDGDGLDEIVSVKDGILTAIEYNGIVLSGFPLDLNFSGIPLIADMNGDLNPEIICKTNHYIAIISNTGNLIEELPLYDFDSHIYLVGIDTNNERNISLVNGNRSIAKTSNQDCRYWLNPYSKTTNYPLVGVSKATRRLQANDRLLQNQSSDFGIDLDRVFNYPNPFEDETKFRFYVGSSNSVVIKIYNMRGYLLDKISLGSLDNYEFNEFLYDTSKFDPGVYIAEVKSDKNESKVLKLLKTK